MTIQHKQLPNSEKVLPKITALWALNEAALGGFLHAFNIPFTGLIVGGVASVLIVLLAVHSVKRGSIVKATLIVLAIKAIGSPYTPLTALIAVFIQGMLGELLFASKKFFTVSAIALAILSSMYSAVQKLFILTILFGTTLWQSIDLFTNFILKQLNFLGSTIQFSYFLISFYLFLHLAFGILFGILAVRLPLVLNNLSGSSMLIHVEKIVGAENGSIPSEKRKKKFWFQKISGVIVFAILLATFFISYFYTEQHNQNALTFLITIFRSVGITLFWFFFVGPVAQKYFRKIIAYKQSKYTNEIESILFTLPYYKTIIKECYLLASKSSRLMNLRLFIKLTLINVLYFDLKE